MENDVEKVIERTKRWVEGMVMRHNFCPFAHRPFNADAIRYAVSDGEDPGEVVEALINELLLLRDSDPAETETSILITPNCFALFEDYNQFLNIVDDLIVQLHLEGVLQVASFHPAYQFEDLEFGDVRNYTNRSVYPMFHLIAERSIEEARATYPDVDKIPDVNMQRLQELGLEEVQRQLSEIKDID